jgi:hypothetical protein
MIEFLALWVVLLAFVPAYFRRVGINLSVTSVFFGIAWLVHGMGYVALTRIIGPYTGQGDLADYLMCARSLGQYAFILQTSMNLDILPTLDIALGLTFFGLMSGCFLADRLYGVTPAGFRNSIQQWDEIRIDRLNTNATAPLVFITIAALLFLTYHAVQDQQVKVVWEYFVSSAGEFEKIRMRQLHGGSQSYLFNLLLATALPFICFYLIAHVKNGHCLLISLSITMACLVILAKLALLSKAPIVIFIAQALLALRLGKSVQVHISTLWIGLMVLGVLLAMILVANPELDGAFEGLAFVMYRIFMAPNEALLEYFASIPHFIDHTWGFDNYLMSELFGTSPLDNTYSRVSELYRGVKGYTTNTMFLGDAWAQFSWLGVVTIPVLAGFMFRWIDIQLVMIRKKSAAAIAGLVLAYFSAFTALSTALQTALWTGGLLMVIPLVWLFSMLEKGRQDQKAA